ncbi:hypothetical protein [Rhodococcus phenolicus]|uniref:hypothetical protein n=1 Tax=Rhodococcus phenolicus TaxID=263849 RepID=UPI0008302AB4|nr:hypothetical protein [Rhodococcus phenolicus]
MTAESVVPEGAEQDIKTTDIDLDELREQLQGWLGDRPGTDTPPRLYNLKRPEHSGMSSISVLFDLDWTKSATSASTSCRPRLVTAS